MSRGRGHRSAVLAAALCAAVILAHQVGAKSARQALVLGSLGPEAVPRLIMLAAIFSLALVPITSRGMARFGPGRLVPAAFLLSGLLHLAEWALSFRFQRGVAVALYLHLGGLGSILISGFWSLVNERFDPHTARRRMGQIAGGGTVGAVLGGVLAAVVGMTRGAASTLPVLAAMHLFCVWLLMALRPARASLGTVPVQKAGLGAGVGLLARHHYLRNLAILVLLGAAGASMVECVFMARANAKVPEDRRLSFFALFYTAISLGGCLLQAAVTRRLLEGGGLGATVSAHPASMAVGSLGAALIPGFPSVAIARGSEQAVHNTLFRSAYELFYTCISPAEKRAAKPVIDVGMERVGDLAGGTLSQACISLLRLGPAQPVILAAAAGAGILGVWIARRLDHGYVVALEQSLRDRAVELNLEDVQDHTTRTTLTNSLAGVPLSPLPPGATVVSPTSKPFDPIQHRIGELQSLNQQRVSMALAAGPLDATLAPFVIPLLAWDEVAGEALRALRAAAPHMTAQLTGAMLDSRQDFAVRRRIPRALTDCPSNEAVAALLRGLDDRRFEVRYRCGRALAAVLAKDPSLIADAQVVLHALSRELQAGRRLWEGHRLLDGSEDDEVVGERANRGLEHVFTLLALVLPTEPVRLCYRALQTDDEMLTGTALEYLDSALPPQIREPLWPFLEDRRPAKPSQRRREEILAELVRSSESIQARLQERKGDRRIPS